MRLKSADRSIWTQWPQCENTCTSPLSTSCISLIEVSTLIIHGREDQVIPVSNSYYLEGILQNGDLAVWSRCGHWSMIERNADFNRQVRDFFLAG